VVNDGRITEERGRGWLTVEGRLQLHGSVVVVSPATGASVLD
jgi:hypothetical protein